MNNAVMISIKPKWCRRIAVGEKTLEVRKTKPKLKPPFKCYIYCTKPSKKHQTVCGCMVLNSDELYRHPEQGIKYGDSIELMLCEDYTKDNFLNGKVIGEFVCNKIDWIARCGTRNDDIRLRIVGERLYTMDIFNGYLNQCQLSRPEIAEYAKCSDIYGWHISDLVIYDKPKELREFSIMDKDAIKKCNNRIRAGQPETVIKNGGWIQGSFGCLKSGIPEWCKNCLTKPLTRPPQSWCYVEQKP